MHGEYQACMGSTKHVWWGYLLRWRAEHSSAPELKPFFGLMRLCYTGTQSLPACLSGIGLLIAFFLSFFFSSNYCDLAFILFPGRYNAPQFILGGPGSGSPWHFHQSAWNALLRGRKRWRLLPPDAPAMASNPIWTAEAPNPREMRCIQRAGDVIYVPAGYAHSVTNTEAVVGLAVELY